MLLDYPQDCLICLLYKDIVNNHKMLGNLYIQLNAASVQLLKGLDVVVQQKFIASNQFLRLFLGDLN
jgi:hypothetical protein